MKMWNVILLLGLLGMLPYADAFSLLCMPSSVNVSEPVSGVSIYVLTSSLDGNTIDANYSWFVDGNLLSSGATTLNFDGNAYSGSVPVSFPLADRNYTLTVNIDVNGASETNSCIIWAYDVPKIHIEPVPPSSESEQWTNVGDYNVWCEDSSACSLSVSINSEQILEANGQMNLNLDDGCNSVSITATDAYGEANEVNYYICVDTAPPTVRDVTVFRLTEDQCAYALSAEANDDVSGVDYASSSVLLDGNVFEEAYPEAAEGGYTGRFIVPTIPYGHQSLELNVCDYAGNCALSEPLPITVLEQTKCLAFEGPYFFGEEGNAGWYVGPVLITMRQLVDGFYALVDGEMTGIVTDITIATDGNPHHHIRLRSLRGQQGGIQLLRGHRPVSSRYPLLFIRPPLRTFRGHRG